MIVHRLEAPKLLSADDGYGDDDDNAVVVVDVDDDGVAAVVVGGFDVSMSLFD